MTEPQPPRAAGPLAGAGRLGAATDQSTFSALAAGAVRSHADYGAGALIACDRLVRIYTAEGIEVQAPGLPGNRADRRPRSRDA